MRRTPAPPATPGLVVVGSIGLDDVRTPAEARRNLPGGSASFACAAASFFTRTGMVGVVGEDFPASCRELFRALSIDVSGLETVPGKTFRWSGVYEDNLDVRRTLSTELNVFADFSPRLPPAYRAAPFVFLANIQPGLQRQVLEQADTPKFVLADTMDLWIRTAPDELLRLLPRVHMLTLNESEARLLSGHRPLLRAARELLGMGPRYVLVKKGEHGSVLFSREGGVFLMPAFPLEEVRDPTGAGDTFAGALMGCLAAGGRAGLPAIRRAMLYGSVVASFGVEAFSLERLASLTLEEIEERASLLREMTRVR